jgi:hypothetical protein
VARVRVALVGLVTLSVVLTLVPASLAAPIGLQTLTGAFPGADRVDLVAIPGGGSLLLAAVGPQRAAFFEVAEDGSLPAEALASFDLIAQPDEPPLSGARLAVLSPERAAVAYVRDGSVRVLVADPFSGMVVSDARVSGVSESASAPTLAAADGGFALAYMTAGATGRTAVVVYLTADGAPLSRDALALTFGYSAALVDSSPTLLLAVQGASAISLYSATPGSLAPAGSIGVAAVAGALWARDGSLHGLLSSSTGLLRMQAPLSSPASATFTAVPGGANALQVFAVGSADGHLVAVVRGASSTLALREDALGAYASNALGSVASAAAATDAYGFARAAVLEGPSAAPTVATFTAGDVDAVAVALSGPSSLEPASSVTFSVTVRAVRSAVTLVGVEVSAPLGWSVQVPSVARPLATGQSASLTFTVGAPAGTPAGTYSVVARPAVVETSYAQSAVATLTVLGGATVSPSCCTSPVDLSPGGSTTVTVGLLNRGATPVVSVVSALAPAGFIVTPSTSSVSISPGATAQVSFTVSASQGTLPLEGGAITLRIAPTDGSASTDLVLPARIRGVFAPVVTALPHDLSAAPGQTVDLPYSVVNTGNLGGLVVLEGAVEGLPATPLVGLKAAMFVPAFTKVDLPVKLTIPPGTAAGTQFEVTVTGAVGQDGAPAGAPFPLYGTVRAAPAFLASFSPGPAVLPGGEALGSLALSNPGNTALTVDLAFSTSEAGFSLRVADGATTGLALPAGAAIFVPISYRAPQAALPGTRNFQLTATSSAGLVLSLDIPVKVLSTHGISLALSPPAPLSRPDTPTAGLDFVVSNSGNTPALVALTFSSALVSLSTVSDGQARQVADPLALQAIAPFSSTSFHANIAPAFLTGETQAPVRVTVESNLADSAFAVATFERLRSDPAILSLSARPVNGPAAEGTLHQVVADIANAGPGTAVGLQAVLSSHGIVLGRVTLDALSPGTSRLIDNLFFVPREATTDLVLTLTSPDSGLDRDLGNNIASATVTVTVPTAPGDASSAAALPVAATSLSLFALAGLALTEIGKSTLISVLFLPLYVKLRPEDVLDQYLRGQIHGFIIANPGEHYNAIKDQLGVTNGALAYHLRVLERAQLLRAVRDGMYKRFYPIGVKVSRKRRLSPFQSAIVKAVRDNPDVSQKRIAELLGVSNQVVNYNVKQLEESRILAVDRTERASKVTLGPEAPAPEGAPIAGPAAQGAPL